MNTPRSNWQHAAALALLVLLAGLAVLRSAVGTRMDGFTVDEPWHIVAGVSYLRTSDYHLNPEHPPLVKLWVGAAMPDTFRIRPKAPLKEKTQERDMVEETMYFDNDFARAQSDARAGMWAFHVLLLLVLGLLIWHGFGLAWAAGSLAFLAIEPTVAAHLPVVMTDLPLALVLAVAALCAGQLAATWQWRWAAGLGVSIGLALATKHSALAGLCGLAALLAVAALWRPRKAGAREVALRIGKLLLSAVLALAVLWSHYGFRFHAGPDGSDDYNRPIAGKIAELNSPVWKRGIEIADRWHLLPRPYLWGLADTVRTGVEGRAIAEHFVWGTIHEGKPPWFSWPAIVVSKLPLALMALTLFGALALWKLRLSTGARWALLALLATTAAHMLALVGSGALWGGVRHAMPVIVALALLAGAAAQWAWQARSRLLGGSVALVLAAALAMTVSAPRLWEYHNELVGGTDNAYRYFNNEGLDLGQRFVEFDAFYHREIKPSGEPLYIATQTVEELMRADHVEYRRQVETMEDTNTAGIYEGWFLYDRSAQVAWPSWDWDPEVVFKGLTHVASIGALQVWRGHQELPQLRATSLSQRVHDYIYKEDGDDWALVASRLEEAVAIYPQSVGNSIELCNAYLRLGQGEAAIRTLRRLLDQDKRPVAPDVRRQAEALILRIKAVEPDAVSQLELMRNPLLE